MPSLELTLVISRQCVPQQYVDMKTRATSGYGGEKANKRSVSFV